MTTRTFNESITLAETLLREELNTILNGDIINNTAPHLPLVEVKVSQIIEGYKSILDSNGDNTFNIHFKDTPYEKGNAIKIRIKNTSNTNLYIGAAYIKNTHEIVCNLFPDRVAYLTPDSHIYVSHETDESGQRNELIPVHLHKYSNGSNWESYTESICLLISTDPKAITDDNKQHTQIIHFTYHNPTYKRT